jgi:hypothetical protein
MLIFFRRRPRLRVVPTSREQSADASARLLKTWTCSQISAAWTALARIGALSKARLEGQDPGVISRSRERPMFFIARHTAPILPGSEAPDKIITKSDKNMVNYIKNPDFFILFRYNNKWGSFKNLDL